MLPRYETKLREIQGMVAEIIHKEVRANRMALEAYSAKNAKGFETATETLKMIENDGNTVDNEIVKTFALFGPEAQELRGLVAYLKMTNELVRIADGTKKYARRIRELMQSDCNLEPFDNAIVQLHKSVVNALSSIYECVSKIDSCDVEETYRKVMVEESKNDDLFAILEKDIMSLIICEHELSASYVRMLGTLRKLERVCDRAVNVANLLMFEHKGGKLQSY
ncbi:MAG: PhoU family transcriptional regulator [Campylobacterales bacterium]|nr:PhoU family transcriptional regulator [Campylobacterales bacterium]